MSARDAVTELLDGIAECVSYRIDGDDNGGCVYLTDENVAALRALGAENERMRKAIEAAPHTRACDFECKCWKRAALGEEG